QAGDVGVRFQGNPGNVLHHQIAVMGLDHRVVDVDDVRMIELPGKRRFREERLVRHALGYRIGVLFEEEHLDGEVALGEWIAREIDAAGRARADLAHDCIFSDLLLWLEGHGRAQVSMTLLRIGVDIGGTKIEALALDAAGREVFRKRIPTPRGDYEATVAAVVSLVAEAGAGTVGVGIPGALSRATGRVKNANSTWLIGRSLKEDLERALKREIRLENDANCFALSEAVDGAGQGARVVFGAILGTGVGGGIVVDGRVLTGPNAIAGEWGHNPLPLPSEADLPLPPCYCGRLGCIETYLSGPGLARDHQQITGARLTPEEIVALGGESLRRYEERLARALATVINLLDPDVIVLGGGMSNVERLYGEVPRLWGPHVFSDRVTTRLARHAHGDSSGVRGAAWLWPSTR